MLSILLGYCSCTKILLSRQCCHNTGVPVIHGITLPVFKPNGVIPLDVVFVYPLLSPSYQPTIVSTINDLNIDRIPPAAKWMKLNFDIAIAGISSNRSEGILQQEIFQISHYLSIVFVLRYDTKKVIWVCRSLGTLLWVVVSRPQELEQYLGRGWLQKMDRLCKQKTSPQWSHSDIDPLKHNIRQYVLPWQLHRVLQSLEKVTRLQTCWKWSHYHYRSAHHVLMMSVPFNLLHSLRSKFDYNEIHLV